MADEKKDQPQNPEPPKIKLNGNGKHHTDKISPVPAAPPKIKFETTRIKLETDQIHVSPPPAEGEPVKPSTLRINLPGSEIAETAPPPPAPSSKQTSRIQIPEGLTPAPATAKKTTARIELPDTVGATPSGAKKATNRVQLPDTVVAQPLPPVVKKQTTRIDVTASPAVAGAQVAKKTTARIELGDALGTAKAPPPEIGVASAHQIPRTVRIKQPDAQPTVVARKVPEILNTAEARKSETARIELPPETIVEQPVTRRKTIRIKRPGVEGETPTVTRAPVTVARAAPAVAGKPDAGPVTDAGITVSEVVEEEAGLVATLCAIAALIVASMLVYVLAAQTIAPNLPFPGKV